MNKLLLSLTFCLSIVAKAEDNPTNLVVWAKDGTKVAYALSEKPKVTSHHNNYFVELPDEFTTQDLLKVIQKLGGITKPVMAIHFWKKTGLIVKIGKSRYRKIKKR